MVVGFDGSLPALREQCQLLARSEEARHEWVDEVARVHDLPNQIAAIWTTTLDGRPEAGGLNEGGKLVEFQVVEEQDEQLERAVLLSRLFRNVVAGNPTGQEICFPIVDVAIQALWRTTAFRLESDKSVQLLTRTLVQFLSNIITQNDSLEAKFWKQTLSMEDCSQGDQPARTGADLIIRLLLSSDSGTSAAAQVLLLNCTLESPDRSRSIVKHAAGTRVLHSMLQVVQAHLDNDEADDEDEGGRRPPIDDTDSAIDLSLPQEQVWLEARRSRYESLGIMYAFFTNLFDRQLFGHLFASLAPKPIDDEEGNQETELISPSQLSLLKLFDSYLHYGARNYSKHSKSIQDSASGLLEILTIFRHLAEWAQSTMQVALQKNNRAGVDSRLVDVHVALVLLLQCMITLGLKAASEDRGDDAIDRTAMVILADMRRKTFVDLQISLLHTLASFSPPISPFRPKSSASTVNRAKPPPEGHVLTSTGIAMSSDAEIEGPSLDHLKRDIVTLLGVLAYRRRGSDITEVKGVQDAVRENDGLLDVLNITQLDERNPYIRERAIFTLQALVLDNSASQEMIAHLKEMRYSA